jgi:hypothetical protein
MNKKFITGAASGLAVALAIPAFAQVSGGVTSSTAAMPSDPPSMMRMQRNFTQEDIQKMIERDDAFLANIDAVIGAQKTATQSHRAALTAAASITDDTERQEAVQKAHEDMRTAMEAFITAHPEIKDMGMMMHFGGKGPGRGPGHMRGPKMMKLSEKFGMTEAELKAAIDGGKTIEQIAEEKGIELPARPGFMRKIRGDDESSAAQ